MVSGLLTLLGFLAAHWPYTLLGIELVVLVVAHKVDGWRGVATSIRAQWSLAALVLLLLGVGAYAAYRKVRGRPARITTQHRKAWRTFAPTITDKLKDDPGTVPLVDGYTDTPSGGVYHARLPRGVTWKDLDPERVRSAFDVHSAVVMPGPTGTSVNVRVRTEDTLSVPQLAPPPRWDGPVVLIGWSEDRRPLLLDLTISHCALGGASRSGKSNTLHQIIAQFAANPDALLWLLDGKEGAELGAWEWRATAFDRGDDDPDPDPTDPDQPKPKRDPKADPYADRVLALVGDVLDEVKRRNRENREAGRQKSGPHHAFALFAIDEVATYSARVPGFDVLLADVMRRALAVNVVVVLATQKATADAIPTMLRDLCETRVAFRCSSREMGVAILGEAWGRYAAELPSVVADPAANAGRCVVVAGGDVTFGRAFLVDAAWLDRAAARGSGAPSPASGGEGAHSPVRAPARADARVEEARAAPSPPAAESAPPDPPPGQDDVPRSRAERRHANREAHRAAQAERDARRRGAAS